MEYRNLVLYLLPVITIDQFDDPDTWHFISIFVHAIRLLSCDKVTDHMLLIADRLIDVFLKCLDEFGHEEMRTFNIHTLRHLTDRVKRFGSLPFLHTSVFESWLGWLKSTLSGTNSTLNVLSRRYIDYRINTPKQRCHTKACVVGSSKLFDGMFVFFHFNLYINSLCIIITQRRNFLEFITPNCNRWILFDCFGKFGNEVIHYNLVIFQLNIIKP